MSLDTEKVIELSRARLVMVIAGSVLMAAAGAWFLTAAADGSFVTEMRRFVPAWAIRAIGITAIPFFGGCAVYAFSKLFDRKPGLILGAAGVTDNSSAVAAGFIPWSEITGLSVFEIQRQRMLVVHVADPEKYVARGNALKRALNRANARMCGSPIVISSTALRIPFDQLHRELATRLARHAATLGSEAAAAPSQLPLAPS